MKTQDIETLKKVLKSFSDSAKTISEIWDENEKCHDALTVDYPFNESFDELALSISNWVENSNTMLNGKAFNFEGVLIVDETTDETGRFSVSPDYYPEEKRKYIKFKD
tara:strand:+ start:126 stop:449 length:324 start_codon:yes stop_codon:yes gene_type:complete